MAKKFLTSIDLSKCELLNASIHNLAAAPSSPADGQIYFNTGDGQMYYYNGSAWQSMSGDITSVEIVAGGGLTGDSSTTNGAFSATLAVGAGTGITVNANDVAIKNAANLSHFYLTKWDALGGNQLASSVIADDGTDAFVYGALDVSGGFTVATDKFVVTAAGNVTAAGTLGVSGNTTLGGTLGVTGATTLSSTLAVTGATTLSSTLSAGDTTLASLEVTGTISTGTNLDVHGDGVFGGSLTVGTTLEVGGATTLSDTLSVAGTATLSSDLSVAGTSTLTGAVSTGAGLTVGTDLAVTSNATIGGTLGVGGAADFASDVTVRGDLTVVGTATNVTFESTTVQLGDAYLTLNQGHNRQLPAATDAGWVVVRSEPEGNISVLWSEANDKFVFANVGNEDGTVAPANVAWNNTVDILANSIQAEGTLTIGSVAADNSATVIGIDSNGVVKSVSTSAIVASGMTFKYSDDGGTATSLASSATLTINAGEGLTASGSGSTITLVGEDATTTNKGIASFATADFGVSSGAVSLNDAVVKTITTDSGALTPSSHGFSILGGEGMNVTHSTTTITVAGEDATTSNKGIVELATSGEVNALTDTARAATPASLAGLRFKTQLPAITGGTTGPIAHNLNGEFIMFQIFEIATGANVEFDIVRIDANTVEVLACSDHADALYALMAIKIG